VPVLLPVEAAAVVEVEEEAVVALAWAQAAALPRPALVAEVLAAEPEGAWTERPWQPGA
jgi:hypothetical protein